MKHYYKDERTGITYTLQGIYYLPNLTLIQEKNEYIGVWGQRHLRYLKKHRKVMYYNLLTSGKLNSYLADVDKQAEERYELIVEQMKQAQEVNEQLKVNDAQAWIRRINNIRSYATEIVNKESIYI